MWYLICVLVLSWSLDVWAQSGHRLTNNQVVVNSRTHWKNWNYPQGVLELSRTLAFEWGPKVRVNCVAPGQFRTDAFDSTYEDGVGDGFVEQPLPDIGDVSDIANGVIFLVSSAARFITGEILYVDGGLILQGPMSALPADGYPERK